MVQRNVVEQVGKRATEQADNIETEEATKQALVMPFLTAMGYDIFDPKEVVPEYVADFGIKHGEKVDYAIMRNGRPVILVECKKLGSNLDRHVASQLGRYFNVTEARIGILTNGAEYWFFSDLEQDNVMDEVPFFRVDLTAPLEINYTSLRYFAKSTFNADEACDAALNMRYTDGMREFLELAYTEPPEDLVRIMTKHVYAGRLRSGRLATFQHLAKIAFHGFVNDKIADTLRKASEIANNFSEEDVKVPEDGSQEYPQAPGQERNIVTTTEEIEAYQMVQAIASRIVDPNRVTIRDTQSYCSVLLDDTNRKPICRLFLQSATKYIIIMSNEFDSDNRRGGKRYDINSVNDIALYGLEISAAIEMYLDETPDTECPTEPAG